MVGGQRSNQESDSLRRPVPGTPVPEAKEGRVDAPSVQFTTAECMDRIPAFQNGRDESRSECDSKERLPVQNRHEGRIFLRTDSNGTPEIPNVSVGRSNIPILLPSVRFGVRTESLHENAEASYIRIPEEEARANNATKL